MVFEKPFDDPFFLVRFFHGECSLSCDGRIHGILDPLFELESIQICEGRTCNLRFSCHGGFGVEEQVQHVAGRGNAIQRMGASGTIGDDSIPVGFPLSQSAPPLGIIGGCESDSPPFAAAQRLFSVVRHFFHGKSLSFAQASYRRV